MNSIKYVAALVAAFSALVVSAVNAAEYTPMTDRETAVAPYITQSGEVPVDVEAQMIVENTIEVAPVVIVAKRAPKPVHQDAQCGAFQFRSVVQGPANGSVRGFCGSL